MLPCASHADVGRAREQVPLGRRRVALRRLDRAFDRLGTAAQHHHDPSFGVELDDHVRPLVDHPDVVVLVDAHLVRELEAVDALAPLLDEGAVRVELEETRVVAPRGRRRCAPSNWSRRPCSRRDTRPSGIFRKFGTDSNGISGTFCAFALRLRQAMGGQDHRHQDDDAAHPTFHIAPVSSVPVR